MRQWCALSACLVVLSVSPDSANAQVFESIGVRALGMAGAFVAVADDASAVYWNPAGLATGAYFSALYDRVHDQALDDAEASGASQIGARRGAATSFALSTPVLGISHYRLQQSEIARLQPSAATMSGGRQDQGFDEVQVRSLTTRQTAVAVAQTLWTGLVGGVALKWIRGAAIAEAQPGRDAAGLLLDRVDDLVARGHSTFDVDVGGMLTSGRARVGVVVRNVRAPRFESPSGETFRLNRQVRAGGALTDGLLTIALDADLTRADTASGDRRSLALGGERWLSNRRLALRAGLRLSTVGAPRPVGAVGGSVMLRSRLYADGQVTLGDRGADRGWGVALRSAF